MKKKTVIFIGLLQCLAFSLSAQPVSKNAYHYDLGDSLTFINGDSSDYKPGASGMDQVWNFSNLHSSSESSMRIKTPDKVQYGNQFSSASYAEYYDDGHANFIKDTAGASYCIGATSGRGTIAHYSGSNITMFRPLAYGQTRLDTFFTKGVFSVSFTGEGYTRITCDGYGKLILPNHIYDHVVRVRVETVEYDTIKFTPAIPTVNYSTSYIWFDTMHPFELLQMDSAFIHTPTQNYEIKSLYYLKDYQLAGISKAYASPIQPLRCTFSNHQLILYASLVAGKVYQLRVSDMAGRLLQQNSFEARNGNNALTVGPDLPGGIYVITVLDDKGGVLTAKAIKQ